ncbi:MAG: AAA family ATPase, partial [Saprospiraceae bacterium]
MLFRIENFGPIKSFEMDLSKDMHLLYGKNSVGKSYAVGILYLFLKHFGEFEVKNPFNFISKNFKNYEEILATKKKKNVFEISHLIETDFNIIFKNSKFYKKFIEAINNTIDLKNLDEGFILVDTDFCKLQITYSKTKSNVKCKIHDKYFLITDDIKISEKIEEREFRIENRKGEIIYEAFDSYYAFELGDFYVVLLKNFLENSIRHFSNTYFLPASRSGLYPMWSSMGSIFAWIAKHRFGMNKSIEIPPLSEAISDYFLNISNSEYGNYEKYAKDIERKVLNGEVILDKVNSKIFYKSFDIKENLELPYSGSMISELSPLVTYLKNIINSRAKRIMNDEEEALINDDNKFFIEEFNFLNKKNILIIEEPEAHLHPEAQVELMKIFADMVQNSNIKLILTSHSDYMFAELSNLILGKKI